MAPAETGRDRPFPSSQRKLGSQWSFADVPQGNRDSSCRWNDGFFSAFLLCVSASLRERFPFRGPPVKTTIALLIGGGLAALYWLREVVRGWQIDRAIERGEDPDDV